MHFVLNPDDTKRKQLVITRGLLKRFLYSELEYFFFFCCSWLISFYQKVVEIAYTNPLNTGGITSSEYTIYDVLFCALSYKYYYYFFLTFFNNNFYEIRFYCNFSKRCYSNREFITVLSKASPCKWVPDHDVFFRVERVLVFRIYSKTYRRK